MWMSEVAKTFILTGASGSGKTSICEALERKYPDLAEIFYFDSMGVPSIEEMVATYGSGENWQKATALRWCNRLAERQETRVAVLEGSIRPKFIRECSENAGLTNYNVAVIDCNDAVRMSRLTIDRSQPELATPAMMHFAHAMRAEAGEFGYAVLDTSGTSLDEAVEIVRAYLMTHPTHT